MDQIQTLRHVGRTSRLALQGKQRWQLGHINADEIARREEWREMEEASVVY